MKHPASTRRPLSFVVQASLLVSLALLMACTSPTPLSETKASNTTGIQLTIGSQAPGSRTVAPGLADLTIEEYQITLSRGTTTRTLTTTGTSTTISNLTEGTWTILVSGLNADGEGIATGSGTVTLTAGTTTSATITLSLVQTEGTGSLSLTYTMPESVGIDGAAALLGTTVLTAGLSNTAGITTVTLSADEIPAGSPLLRLSLKKGSTVLATVADSVWIYQNVCTTATVALPADRFGAVPEALASLTVTGGKNQNTLSWVEEANSTASSYTIARSASASGPFTPLATVDTTTSTYLDSGLGFQETWYYQMTPQNRFGIGAAVTAAGTTSRRAIVSLAIGDNHSAVVFEDGSLWTFGRNTEGQLGIGSSTETSRTTPTRILASGVAQVYAGGNRTFVLKNDSTLWACGSPGTTSAFGNGSVANLTSLTQLFESDGVTPLLVQDVGLRDTSSLVLRLDGKVMVTGYFSNGAIGALNTSSASYVSQWTSSYKTGGSAITAVASVSQGSTHAMALTKDGSLWVTGLLTNPLPGVASGVSNIFKTIAPSFSTTTETILAVWAGKTTSFLKTTAGLYVCGTNSNGELGTGTTSTSVSLTLLPGFSNVTLVVTGGITSPTDTFFLKDDGSLWGCGLNANGELQRGASGLTATPVQVASGVARAAITPNFSLVAKTDGTLWAAGLNTSGQFGNGASGSTAQLSPLEVSF